MNKGKDNKPHIGIFGRRNTGKSSLINCITGQEVAIVSDEAGTTTDPVKRSMEIFGIGPAIIIDTAGIDDVGELGRKRVESSLEVIKQIDCALLLISDNVFGEHEEELISEFEKWELPFLIVHNKSDEQQLHYIIKERLKERTLNPVMEFSTRKQKGLELLIATLRQIIPNSIYNSPSLLSGLVKKGDYVLLITPIDNEAPDGRMILPQVMAIRDVLDNDCMSIVLKEDKVEDFFKDNAIQPALAVTDSQVFEKLKDIVPASVPFTSFSILFARMRGDFYAYMRGTPEIDKLEDGDRLLIMESCSHQVNCDDIGRVKLPDWIRKHTGRSLEIDVVAGLDSLPRPMDSYRLVIQCGGCMITRRQLKNRLKPALITGVPVTNYGLAIAWVNGIYNRVISPFEKVNEEQAE